MITANTLSNFFESVPMGSLGHCARERIHLSGAIQGDGALIVLEPGSQKIVGLSENLDAFLACTPKDLLGAPLAALAPEIAEEILGLSEEQQVLHEVLEFSFSRGETQYDIVTHLHDGRRLIEFLPNHAPAAKAVRTNMRLCSKSCAQILHAEDFEEALDIAAAAARKITGYARAKIYRFLSDWSGEVLAESCAEGVPSYKGLHFPASDIPKQVREMMMIVPYRAIGSAQDETVSILTATEDNRELDLTWSVNRSVSRMHTAYLRNMGINATFSCSLIHKGRLWGMIALHHTEEGIIPFDSWSLLQEIGTALMLRLDQSERTAIANKITELRQIENRFASALRKNGKVEEVISTLVPVLQNFLRSDGFAFQYGSTLYTSGETPPRDFIPKLIQWGIKRRETYDQYQTTALHRDWAPALEHIETACGVLIQPIVTHRVCQLIWFRKPISRSVHWAGKPGKEPLPEAADMPGVLGPRRSFETWIQEHRDESVPWLPSELESAREIFKEFLDIIAAQLLLQEENRSLRRFAASAAHDLKAPLRGISMALDIMQEERFDEEIVRETHAIAAGSARRLKELTSGLLELAVLREQKHEFSEVNLSAIAEEIGSMLSLQLTEARGRLEIGSLPTAMANERLILRLFLNLIGNAIKYRDPDKPLHIRMDLWADDETCIELAIADTGLGIAAEDREKIFMPMQRLHSHDEIEGSGLGLTICEQILEIHGGKIRLDPDYTDGARFIISMSRTPGEQPMPGTLSESERG